MRRSHIFGPVLSRRLGLSLGVDLIPYKKCTYNCVYCECGHTPGTTLIRQEFFSFQDVIDDLDKYLINHPKLDTITFAGSGEPTLSSSLGKILEYLKSFYPEYCLTVLTNGSLLAAPGLSEELKNADRVIPTLTSVYQETFERIHNPNPVFQISQIIEGLIAFRKKYQGLFILEIFVIPGLNTTSRELSGLKNAIIQIQPDAIQLNTLDRPPADDWVLPASLSELEKISTYLNFTPTFITCDTIISTPQVSSNLDPLELILAVLSRRPSTLEDLSRMSGLSHDDVLSHLTTLRNRGFILTDKGHRGTFYCIKNGIAED